MAERESEKTDLEKIDKSIRITHIFVVSWIVVISLFYFLWFWFFNDKRLSDASADWGVAGDFFGGLLNPLVAYCAFYWLTKSVKLQKEELAETRASLTEAANAQRKQAEYAHISVRLNALSTLINSIMIEVETQRTQLQFLLEQVNQCKGQGEIELCNMLAKD